MTMFQGYAHKVDFFTSFDYCLAEPGEIYAVYLPHGGRMTVQLQPGRYAATWWNTAFGGKTTLPLVTITAPSWTSPPTLESDHDWALLLQKQ
jgi:Putative collagen-binding domain of a collagenase